MSKSKQKAKQQSDLISIEDSIIASTVRGTDPDSLPFAEWSDQDINFEKWNEDQNYHKEKLSGPTMATQQKSCFEDPQQVRLPPSVNAEEWKRISHLYPGASFVVFTPQAKYPDLLTHNPHLLRSEFYRNFISTVEMLMYIGSTKPFQDEYGSPVFNAQAERNWRPWQHIYSNCKITKGQQEHTPVYNPTGKYIVRLYWMGTWRKVYVDDLVPLDRNENIILPVLDVPKPIEVLQKSPEKVENKVDKQEDKGRGKDKKDKKKKKDKSPSKDSKKSKKGSEKQKWTVEIWPMILCKALLKVASLSWAPGEELRHFDMVQCLTGWTPQKILVRGKGVVHEELWDILLAYGQRFTWETKESKKSSKSSKSSKTTKGSSGKGKEKKAKKGNRIDNVELLGIETQPNVDHYLMACCNDFEHTSMNEIDKAEEEYSNRKINKHHNILISQVRTLPLEKPPPRPEIKVSLYIPEGSDGSEIKTDKSGIKSEKSSQTWKLIFVALEFWQTWRYEQWATERGLIPPDLDKLNIKSLKIVSTFKKSVKKGHSAESVKFKSTQEDNIADQKPEKSAKTPKSPTAKSKKGRGGVRLEPDPSHWQDFDELQPNIEYLTVYFYPKSFKMKTKISDIQFTTRSTDFQQVLYPYEIKDIRNEPLYIFTDSIDHKFLVINLSQSGNTKMLDPYESPQIYKDTSLDSCLSEDDFCMKIIKAKTVEPNTLSWRTVSTITFKSLKFDQYHNNPINFLLEEYNWYSNKYGKNVGSLRTMGSSTLVLNLKPGRQCFKLWISSHTSYVLQILSDTPVTVGRLEEFLNVCKQESQTLTNLCYEMSSCFGRLVNSFGMPEHSISLRNFYESYKPIESLTKKELNILHNAILEELFKMVLENSGAVRVEYCLRLLFLQLRTFNYINPYVEEPHLLTETYMKEEHIEYAKIMQRAAVRIQAFFKGIYIRSLMKKLSTAHKQHMSTFEILKSIYKDVFSSDKRLATCLPFLRKVFERNDVKEFRDKFEVFKDMKQVAYIMKYSRNQQAAENSWLALCRYDFFINSVEPIPIKINMFTTMKNYYVRVFDRDTCKEMKRITNNAAVISPPSNINGYTALCYGYCKESEHVTWKLYFATQKMSRDNMIIIPEQSITSTLLKENYSPNCQNVICKYLAKVNSNTLLTVHLTTSYPDVKVKLKVFDNEGIVIQETQGIGSALIPIVYLKVPEHICKMANGSNVNLVRSSNSLGRLIGRTASKEQLLKKDLKSTSEKTFRRSQHRHVSSESKNKLVQFSRDHIASSNTSNIGTLKDRRRSQRASVSFLTTVALSDEVTEYTIVATVESDSWPLTADEWKTVEKIKQADYLHLSGELSQMVPLAYQRLMGMSSTNTTKKLSKPYFILDMVYNSGDVIQFVEDRRKQEYMRSTKIRWNEYDPDRFERAKEIRDAYLDEHLFDVEEPAQPEDTTEDLGVEEEETTEERSNNPHEFDTHKLETLDISKFLLKPLEEVDEEKCITRRSELFQFDSDVLDKVLKKFESKQEPGAMKSKVAFQTEEMVEEDLEMKSQSLEMFDFKPHDFPYQTNQSAMDSAIMETIKNIINLDKDADMLLDDVTPASTPTPSVGDILKTDESVDLISRQIQDTQTLAQWFSDIREDSYNILEESRGLLKQYIQKVESAGKGKKKDQDKAKKTKKVAK